VPVTVSRDVRVAVEHRERTVLAPRRRALLAEMQAAVPEGRAVLAVVDHPFALDYRRNAVFNIDVPGAASPPPGMPFFRGPGPVKAYLKGLGVGYVASRDFDAPAGCLYRRDGWTFHAEGENHQWRAQSRYYLDLMDNLDALAATEDSVFSRGGLRVTRLR